MMMGLAGAGVSAMSSITQYNAQVEQANAQERTFWQNRANAITSMDNQYGAISRREIQEGDAMSLKEHAAMIDAAQKGAQVQASAAEGGVTGTSVGNLSAEVARQNDFNTMQLRTQYKANVQQLQDQASGIQAQTQSTINSVPRGQYPSSSTLALGLAGAGIKAMGSIGDMGIGG